MAASAFAVQSANTVGYASPSAAANFNFFAPQFFDVGYNTTSIQNIQLDDGNAGTVGWGDSMQIVGPFGNATAAYMYWNPVNLGMTGACYWSDDTMAEVDISFDQGDGFMIDNMNSLTFTVRTSGEVPTNGLSFAAASNFNWTGNPFPQAINIQDVQLDDGNAGSVGWGDSMQVVGPFGNATAAYMYWNPVNLGMTGACYWSDDTMAEVDVTFAPGQGFMIDNMNGLTFDVKIDCPYTL